MAALESSERMCGNRPSSMPARNTIGNSRPLALCSVSSETGARSSRLSRVGNQRGVIQKFGDGLRRARRLPRGVHQFVQVAQARFRFRIVVGLEHFGVAGALQNFLAARRLTFAVASIAAQLLRSCCRNARSAASARAGNSILLQHPADRRPHAQLMFAARTARSARWCSCRCRAPAC